MKNGKLISSDTKKYLYRIIARRDYTEDEIRKKVASKFDIAGEDLDEIISILKRYELLDDQRYKNNYMDVQLSGGAGPYRILRNLKNKGIGISIETVEEFAAVKGYDLYTIAKKQLSKKLSYLNKGDKRAVVKKSFDFLLRKGFDVELIKRILKEEGINEGTFL